MGLTNADPTAAGWAINDPVIRSPTVSARCAVLFDLRRSSSDRWILGSSPECSIHLDDPSGRVSRRHAVASREGEIWTMQDLGSTNGIRVNREDRRTFQLAPGDEIELGGITLLAESQPLDGAVHSVAALARMGGAPVLARYRLRVPRGARDGARSRSSDPPRRGIARRSRAPAAPAHARRSTLRRARSGTRARGRRSIGRPVGCSASRRATCRATSISSAAGIRDLDSARVRIVVCAERAEGRRRARRDDPAGRDGPDPAARRTRGRDRSLARSLRARRHGRARRDRPRLPAARSGMGPR